MPGMWKRRGGQGNRGNFKSFTKENVDLERDAARNAAITRRSDLPIDENEDQIILCVSVSGGDLGAAVYEQQNALVKVMNDVQEKDLSVLNALIAQVKPTKILVNKAQDLAMINYLSKKYGDLVTPSETDDLSTTINEDSKIPKFKSRTNSQTNEDEEEYGNQADISSRSNAANVEEDDEENFDEEDEEEVERDENVEFAPLNNNLFKFEKARQRISELVNGSDARLSAEEKNLMVKFRVSYLAVNMTRAFGALLHYMDAVRLGVETEHLNVRPPVKCVKTFVLEKMVDIDWNTFRALDIFAASGGKKQRNGNNQAKGSSLFEMLNKCKSTVGKREMRKWFRNPTTDRDVLRMRQKAIGFFAQDCNIDITAPLARNISRLKSVDHIMRRFRMGTARVCHWDSLLETLRSLVLIRNVLNEKEVKLDLFTDGFKFEEIEELQEICVIMQQIIDFPESKLENRCVINTGVDNVLDEHKYLYHQLPIMLTGIAEKESTRLKVGTGFCSCVYVPILGFILTLPVDFPHERYSDIRVLYRSERTIHVKTDEMNRLDEQLGDVKMEIIDKEALVMMRLKKMVLKYKTYIQTSLAAAAALDVVISLAYSARKFGWMCPILCDDAIIDVVNCTHPLAEIINNKGFVPNDVLSGGVNTKLKILSGPNACGKSVYMKQVGLVAFLAHIGSYVPAENARIGPIDRIVTRMFTVDTVLDGMSTFAKDVEQVSIALARATTNSLVIIDEFGKGTMMEVGLSLLASCLTFWINKEEDCPHLLIASHFHSLSKYIHADNPIVSFHTFLVERGEGKLKFLYKLANGVVDCSFAVNTAREEKIDDDVLARAVEVYSYMKNGNSLYVLSSEFDLTKQLCIADRMEEICDEIEKWDIEKDCLGFGKLMLNLIENDEFASDADEDNITQSQPYESQESGNDESTIVPRSEYSEGMDGDISNDDFDEKSKNTTTENVVEREESMRNESHTSRSNSNKNDEEEMAPTEPSEKMESESEDDDNVDVTSNVTEKQTTVERSILRSEGRKSERSNLSVSFALDGEVSFFESIYEGFKKARKGSKSISRSLPSSARASVRSFIENPPKRSSLRDDSPDVFEDVEEIVEKSNSNKEAMIEISQPLMSPPSFKKRDSFEMSELQKNLTMSRDENPMSKEETTRNAQVEKVKETSALLSNVRSFNGDDSVHIESARNNLSRVLNSSMESVNVNVDVASTGANLSSITNNSKSPHNKTLTRLLDRSSDHEKTINTTSERPSNVSSAGSRNMSTPSALLTPSPESDRTSSPGSVNMLKKSNLTKNDESLPNEEVSRESNWFNNVGTLKILTQESQLCGSLQQSNESQKNVVNKNVKSTDIVQSTDNSSTRLHTTFVDFEKNTTPQKRRKRTMSG